MDFSSGVPDPLEGDEPRPDHEDPSTDWVPEEDGPFFALLPPEDRLWRHPSEAAAASAAGDSGAARSGPRPGGEHRSSANLQRSILRSTWAIAMIAGLVGATAATGIGLASGLWAHETTVVRSIAPATSSVSLADIGPEPTNWTAVDDSVSASIVTVSVQGSAGPQVGSGLVFLQSTAGRSFVVTDRSLFARDRAVGWVGTIDVTFLSGAVARAKLVGDDPLSGLAVLSITETDVSAGVPAALGTVAALRPAQQVLVVGSHTAPSVSTATVSAEDRTVSLSDGTDLDGLLALAMPPLSATASGGPLLNQFGQVVGVTLGLDPVDPADQQLTFAVPIDEASRIATELVDGIQPTHPWLGVANAEDVPSTMAHQLGVDGGVQAGSVAADSPAGQAGVRADDVITALDNKPIMSTGALLAQVETCVPGRNVPITYLHAGRTVNTTVRVGEEPRDS